MYSWNRACEKWSNTIYEEMSVLFTHHSAALIDIYEFCLVCSQE